MILGFATWMSGWENSHANEEVSVSIRILLLYVRYLNLVLEEYFLSFSPSFCLSYRRIWVSLLPFHLGIFAMSLYFQPLSPSPPKRLYYPIFFGQSFCNISYFLFMYLLPLCILVHYYVSYNTFTMSFALQFYFLTILKINTENSKVTTRIDWKMPIRRITWYFRRWKLRTNWHWWRCL